MTLRKGEEEAVPGRMDGIGPESLTHRDSTGVEMNTGSDSRMACPKYTEITESDKAVAGTQGNVFGGTTQTRTMNSIEEEKTMLKMMVKFQNMMKSEKGQGMVEYGLIIGLVAVVLIVALTALSTGLGGIFGRITSALPAASST